MALLEIVVRRRNKIIAKKANAELKWMINMVA
jgi:hypothetical protein